MSNLSKYISLGFCLGDFSSLTPVVFCSYVFLLRPEIYLCLCMYVCIEYMFVNHLR